MLILLGHNVYLIKFKFKHCCADEKVAYLKSTSSVLEKLLRRKYFVFLEVFISLYLEGNIISTDLIRISRNIFMVFIIFTHEEW